MPELRQVHGVLAGAATDVEKIFATREAAFETAPGHLAQRPAECGVRELRIVPLRQSIEGRGLWLRHFVHANASQTVSVWMW